MTATRAATCAVLLVDDHAVFAESLAFVLDADARFGAVRRAGSLAEARDLATGGWWDLAVVDVELPDGDGTDLVSELRAARPGGRVVLLTAHPRATVRQRAAAYGAEAVLAKGTALAELLDVLSGTARTTPPAEGPRSPDDPSHALTPREVDVVRLLARGEDARGIARELGLSVHTVRDHVKSCFAKLGAHSQVSAVVAAHRAGLINVDRV